MTRGKLLLHQVRLEQRGFWRNPEPAFFTFALPISLLLIFGAMSRDETAPGRPGVSALTLVIPGFLAFGLILAAYGNLASTIAILRSEGVLKRIRATPLPPGIYLGGLIGSVLTTCLAMSTSAVLLGGLLFGSWPQSDRLPLLFGTLSLGVLCFAALGLAISTAIPTADAAGPVTNATTVPLSIISGTFTYSFALPHRLDQVVNALPIKPFTESLRASYDPVASALPTTHLVVLAVWAVIGVAVTYRFFRWEP